MKKNVKINGHYFGDADVLDASYEIDLVDGTLWRQLNNIMNPMATILPPVRFGSAPTPYYGTSPTVAPLTYVPPPLPPPSPMEIVQMMKPAIEAVKLHRNELLEQGWSYESAEEAANLLLKKILDMNIDNLHG